MRKILLFSLLTACALNGFAKPVDELTAKKVGYNFLRGESVQGLSNAGQLELVHTSASADGKVKYFYVFNLNRTGFVMVSADDQVVPVFAYSNDGGFDPTNIPDATKTWLANYASEIAFVIEKNFPATAEISEKWAALVSGEDPTTGNKTTAFTTVPRLLTTTWNQNPYYNELCPFDATENKLVPSGCVATAMTQIMKYWNWPAHGSGMHSYNHPDYGTQSADFGATTYSWNSMPNTIGSSNNAVATLTYQAGVAVNMNYGPEGSGAVVIDAMSSQSAESALRTYFGYDPNLSGIYRNGTASWISTLKNELNEARPVLYAGFGSAGGHAWVADGYDKNDYFHINWGWGGSSDGYFSVDAMNPPALGAGGGSGGFNNTQHAIIGIKPPASAFATPDQYEMNNFETAYYSLPVSFNGNTAKIVTTGSNFHITNDNDYYAIFLPIGDNYTMTARLQDAGSSTNGNTYSVDAKLGIKEPAGANWTAYYGTEVPGVRTYNGGGTVLFRVASQTAAAMGDYQLEIDVTRTTTGVQELSDAARMISVYPNPATDKINIDLAKTSGKVAISIIDLQGRSVYEASHEGNQLVTIPVGAISNGMYFVRVQSEQGTITEKISINR
ncbi:thiol protease/hemagglutinin PrtT [Polluticoccus soli]|uniref:thiol protease/hemagglutinin PrtT n=1 Tax=Polluticoccus soli TaxID=3034150 RepID=UPI0023E0F854|nr:thiol protease/hemagglutinin PrtT [Flavipsychrobacter sp. JY13-12]